jgi:hypothetical protein
LTLEVRSAVEIWASRSKKLRKRAKALALELEQQIAQSPRHDLDQIVCVSPSNVRDIFIEMLWTDRAGIE